MASRLRWFAVCVFALAATWNYLDRALLTMQAPRIIQEFHLSNEGYGWLTSAFSFAYALASPFVGWFLDWAGLEAGIAISVGVWSLATLLTGLTKTYGQLVAVRVILGIWESAGVPAAGKLNAMYLDPKNRALGAALTQVGISVGTSAAALAVARTTMWRTPFFLCGALGLAWIPVWLFVRRSIQAPYAVHAQGKVANDLSMFRDRRLILLSIANMLWMPGYVVWTNWNTPYLVHRFPTLTTAAAAGYSWFPPIAALLGGFVGGWLARKRIEGGSNVLGARISVILISALAGLCALLVPLSPSPAWAVAAIGLSWFWIVAGSVNLYTLPVDIWGPERAGTAVSALVFSYGIAQTIVSPGIGRMVDQTGYGGVFWLVAIPPLAAWALTRWGVRPQIALP